MGYKKLISIILFCYIILACMCTLPVELEYQAVSRGMGGQRIESPELAVPEWRSHQRTRDSVKLLTAGALAASGVFFRRSFVARAAAVKKLCSPRRLHVLIDILHKMDGKKKAAA